jgi:hypothetical protein
MNLVIWAILGILSTIIYYCFFTCTKIGFDLYKKAFGKSRLKYPYCTFMYILSFLSGPMMSIILLLLYLKKDQYYAYLAKMKKKG